MPHILSKQKKQPSSLQEVFSSIHGNCIRSHAFYKMSKTCWVPGRERETVTKTLVENNKKKEIFTTFSQKDKGFKNKHLDLTSQNQWQFLQCSSSWLNRSIYTVLSRLKALDKCYLNYFTSAWWSNKYSCKWTNSPRAWKLLLYLGCRHIVKGHLGVEYSTAGRPVLHRVPEAIALLANPFILLTKTWAGTKLAESGIYTNQGALSDALTLLQFINKHTQVQIWKKKKIPSSHLQERNKTVPCPSMDKSSLITTVL